MLNVEPFQRALGLFAEDDGRVVAAEPLDLMTR